MYSFHYESQGALKACKIFRDGYYHDIKTAALTDSRNQTERAKNNYAKNNQTLLQQ